ncbi:MAG: phytanoyl-CoA dioxygenase family protein [Phycisphaeraceae bacterium]|nr:phytanoyl-CoA dioxygenase family protein [Phycisphaeraceae bacterium]
MEPFTSRNDGRPPKGWFNSPLDQRAEAFYKDNGFLVLDRAVGEPELDAILTEAADLCRNRDGLIENLPTAPDDLDDEAVMSRALCIHYPHKLSQLFLRMLSHRVIVETLTRLIGPDVKCIQSMMFFKAAGKPGQAWHQDEIFIPSRDRSLAGAWLALDDATIENGCLWVIPGSHKPGVIWHLEQHNDPRFDCTREARGFPYTAADERPVEVKRGSIIFFNGYLLHRSLPNVAKRGYRRSLVNHYMSAQSLLAWGWTEGINSGWQDFRDFVMVAGHDPYAYKGLEDLSKPYLRSEDSIHGCGRPSSRPPGRGNPATAVRGNPATGVAGR